VKRTLTLLDLRLVTAAAALFHVIGMGRPPDKVLVGCFPVFSIRVAGVAMDAAEVVVGVWLDCPVTALATGIFGSNLPPSGYLRLGLLGAGLFAATEP
jgi:hypothetical protein